MDLPQTPTVTAVKEVEKLKGASGAHVFLCDDGRERVVKFSDGQKAVVNEHLGHKLAQALALPVPGDAFVMVPQSLIDEVPDLVGRHVHPGLHYGTEYDRAASDLERIPAPDPRLIQNGACLPGVLAFNILLYNTDTGNQNHLLTPTGAGGYSYTIVDLAGASGGNWNEQTLQATSSAMNLVGTHPLFVVTVAGIDSFSPYLEKVEGLGEPDLFAITASIPEAWGVKAEERAAWVQFILKRSRLVRQILLSNSSAFPSWRRSV